MYSYCAHHNGRKLKLGTRSALRVSGSRAAANQATIQNQLCASMVNDRISILSQQPHICTEMIHARVCEWGGQAGRRRGVFPAARTFCASRRALLANP